MRDYANKTALLGHPSGAKTHHSRTHSAKKPARVTEQKHKRPGLRWALVLLVLLLLTGGVIHFLQSHAIKHLSDVKALITHWRHPQTSPKPAQSDTTQPANPPTRTPEQTAPQPTFDFYTVLPNRTTEDESDSNTPDTTTSPTQNQMPSRQFMLQVASYQDPQAANKMRAQLLLIGLSPTIDKTDSGWYRVDLGPFDSTRAADVVRHKIQSANINGAMIRQVSS